MIKKEFIEFDLNDMIAAGSIISPRDYQYYEGLKKRRIVFNNQVDEDIVEGIILPLIDMDNDGTGLPIEIYLSSPGGSLFDGMNLCAVIDRLKTPTTIIAPTYCYSMGGLFLMAGKNNPNVIKKCYPFTTALIHSGSTYLSGNTSSVRDTFQFYERFEEKINDYIISHTDITVEEYDKMEKTEWYMTAEDLLEKGIVDEIL